MSRRSGIAAVGALSIVIAWQLGSLPLAVAGIAGLLVASLAWGWERGQRGLTLTRELPSGPFVEGDDLRYEVRLAGARLPGSFALEERLRRFQPPTSLRRAKPTHVVIRRLSRGRLEFGHALLTADDPLGVARVTRELADGPAILVRPRVPLLDALFTEGGARFGSGRTRATSGPSGLELRGVREYRDGEPLRAVHWVSTARRGRLMIRELEEPPHHDATVTLDLDGIAEVGPTGSTSLDEAVRAAGALVRAQLERGRAVRLVVSGAQNETTVAGSMHDWDDVLDLLAEAEPRRDPHRANGRAREPGSWGRTILVTARADAVPDTPADLGGVVLIDAPTYAGQARSPALPALLRLAAHGVPVTIVRAGDDLKAALEGALLGTRAATDG